MNSKAAIDTIEKGILSENIDRTSAEEAIAGSNASPKTPNITTKNIGNTVFQKVRSAALQSDSGYSITASAVLRPVGLPQYGQSSVRTGAPQNAQVFSVAALLLSDRVPSIVLPLRSFYGNYFRCITPC